MEIKIADKAGFCFGVDRAVKIAYDNAKNTDKKIYTYGMLIHNSDVTRDLENMGVRCATEISDIPKNAAVIVRAHGISKKEYEELLDKSIEIIDATCPFVKRIHKIVEEEHGKGRQVVIVGDKNHPEVKGINGWCENSAIIIGADENIDELLTKNTEIPLSLVAQTTMRKEKVKKIEKSLKKHFTNAIFFDTICSATEERQIAAAKLSEECDLMFVFGGSDSSNTNKLFEICREGCPKTFKLENAKGLNELAHLLKNKKIKKVGITAGASTPDKVIKEAKLTMAEITNEMNFAEALEETLKPLSTGDIVKGVVIGITPTEVQVDIDGKYDGVIPADEVTSDTSVDFKTLVKVGDEIDVFVVHVSDRDGVVTLSKKKIDAEKGLQEIRADFENGTVLTGRISEIVRGGIVTNAKGVRVFIPASEAAERFVEDLGSLLNTEVSFKIIKMDKDRRGRLRVVGSIKTVARELSQKKAEEFWAAAEVNKKYTGTVKSLTAFGAFIDLGGVDGLIHISELSDSHIKHPSEVLKVGDSIEVYIKDMNKETGKISLVKELEEEKKAREAAFWAGLEVGKEYTGTVKSLTAFGAFIDLGGVDGLVHVSELSWQRIKHPSEVVKVGDSLTVYIKEIDVEKKKVSLGYKKEEDSPWYKATKDLNVGENIKCKVVRILPFGAFAEVAPFVDGLIHISQIANTRIEKPSDVLNIGDEIEVQVTEINHDTKQIGLSRKVLLPDYAPEAEEAKEEEVSDESYTEEGSFTLGDILDAE
ncbi:MAG: 4-hydroxy-3-methylbut-2-enyl diphosphate reductase [Clostridia bacterium]|nr:4-hydroxy-3-methylbut-2-enyl diphosphate reductase [Clostridia bacterium]